MGDIIIRGIRGATTVSRNTSQEITEATQELLNTIVYENDINLDDICSVFFTVTKDLNAQYPARAAREMGWTNVPLLCAQEIDVPGGLPQCIRVLMHVNTTKKQDQIKHIYLRQASRLRPDLTDK
ncbi:MAG: chorismate mutase [Desulfotomaculum sp.]|nr:chorismate mutase [Desulfotomaculum sp.]